MQDSYKYSAAIPNISGWYDENKVYHHTGPFNFWKWLNMYVTEGNWTAVFGGQKPHIRFKVREEYLSFLYWLENNR